MDTGEGLVATQVLDLNDNFRTFFFSLFCCKPLPPNLQPLSPEEKVIFRTLIKRKYSVTLNTALFADTNSIYLKILGIVNGTEKSRCKKTLRQEEQ